MVDIATKTLVYLEPGKLYSQAVHVVDRPTDTHRKVGLVGSPSHDTHTVASEATLARSKSLHPTPAPKSLHPHLV